MEITRHEIGTHKCDALEYGNLVFISGIVAKDTSQDVQGQAREILAKIDGLLTRAGTDRSKIMMANIWLNDVSHYKSFNEIWNAWVAPGKPPARACVGATLALPGLLVEVAMIAGK